MPKTLFILIILISCVLISFGQKVSNIELLERVENFGTDYFRSTFDNLLVETEKNPNSKAYVVIYGTKDNLSEKFALEQRVRNHLKFRSFDKAINNAFNRIFIVRGADKEKARIELWVSNNGAEPNIDKSDWNYKLPDNQQTFLFGRGNITVEDKRTIWLGECSMDCEPTSDIRLFAEHLRVNPKFEGHLIIYSDSRKEAESTIKLLTNILANEYKISPKRIKGIYNGKKRADQWFELELKLISSNKSLENARLWILLPYSIC